MKFTIIAGITLLVCATEARADYPPYRYAPVGVNRVILVPRDAGGGACDCNDCCSGHSCLFGHHGGHGGGSSYGGGMRMEYAPYRYLPAQRQMPVPPGLAGQIYKGSLAEQRFIDLQPRYTYPRSAYAPVNQSPVPPAPAATGATPVGPAAINPAQ